MRIGGHPYRGDAKIGAELPAPEKPNFFQGSSTRMFVIAPGIYVDDGYYGE